MQRSEQAGNELYVAGDFGEGYVVRFGEAGLNPDLAIVRPEHEPLGLFRCDRCDSRSCIHVQAVLRHQDGRRTG